MRFLLIVFKIFSFLGTAIFSFNLLNFSFLSRTEAVGGGFGLRLDFDFFIMRVDLAIPLHNPYMYKGERWIWQERTQYDVAFNNLPISYSSTLRGPFQPRLNIGIGYPF